ncbi:MAG: GatB/YqeY domain-containing protein [Planctomycetota bacterium]|nr:MAG: GatB/YqeY domain-containing protein [Planctomycetota bacterium]
MNRIVERILADTKAAMKARDKARLETLRLAMNELKNAGIDKKGAQGLTDEVASPTDHLDEAEAVAVLQKLVKRRKDAAAQFEQGGRADLAERERAEAAVIEEYLPAGLGEAELEELVRAAIAETGATSMKEMGAVMKAALARAAGRADGSAVSAVVRRLLGS